MKRPPTRILFFGTPIFAVRPLEALQATGAELSVITMPAKPAGRGRLLQQPPVRHAADRLHLPCLQPEKLDEYVLSSLGAWHPDVAVVAAYGKIFRPAFLRLPKHGFLNIHPSLLPRHRGATPIQAAILAGDAETGVTIMQLDEGLDTGPLLARQVLNLKDDETAGSLSEKLSTIGADLLCRSLPGYLSGLLHPQPQNNHLATMTHPLTPRDSNLNWDDTALSLERRIRAMHPSPGAWSVLAGVRWKILQAEKTEYSRSLPPGTIASLEDKTLAVVCGDARLLRLTAVQPAGKRPASAAELFRGYHSHIGERFGKNL